jgi:hypothetical protein
MRGVAIFAKACFGHPSPSKRQKLNATANAFGAPIRPRHLVPTQQGVANQLLVKCYTPSGGLLLVKAKSAEHKKWMEEVNPKQ